MDLLVSAEGLASWGERRFRCALGRGGIRADKREGDGATPVGAFVMRRALYRPDRLARPESALAVAALGPLDAWCDDPADPAYNRQVRQPFRASFEPLWRAGPIYDLIVVLGYNDDPVVPGRGSAIFLHQAWPDFRPTAGCVALAAADLARVLAEATPQSRVVVAPAG